MSVIGQPGLPIVHRPGLNVNVAVEVEGDNDGWTRVGIEGELDASNADRLEAVLDRLRIRGVRRVEIDLSRVDFLDSSGLRAIVTRKRTLVDAGGQLRLIDVPRRLQRVFELSGLERLLG